MFTCIISQQKGQIYYCNPKGRQQAQKNTSFNKLCRRDQDKKALAQPYKAL